MDCVALAFQNTLAERFRLLECVDPNMRKAYLDIELYYQHFWIQQIKHNKLLIHSLDLVIDTTGSDQMVYNAIRHGQELVRIIKHLEQLVDESVSILINSYPDYVQTAYQYWQSDADQIRACNGDFLKLVGIFGQMVFLSELQANYY